MKLKLKVEATVRVCTDGDNVDVSELKDLVRDYMRQNKFQLNQVTLVANYQDEGCKEEADGE